MVSQAFTKLPQSSEQILHPEKYFSNEAPIKVTRPELRNLLGAGWKKIDADVNGEWGCYLILDQFLNNAEESKRAAAGWAGDRFAVYEGPQTSDVFLAQVTAWDTANDAKEFFDAYLNRTFKRYPGIDKGPGALTETGDQRNKWRAPSGQGVIELRGSRVVILEGVPANADVDKLLNLIWQPSRPTTRKS